MRVYPYHREAVCPKCGSAFSDTPVWHGKLGRWYWDRFWPWPTRCAGLAMDHLHIKCKSCGVRWNMACADLREEIERETGI